MRQAFQVVMNGYGHTIKGSLEDAFEHIALAVHHGGLPPLRNENPMIAGEGLEISRLHCIRRAVEHSRIWDALEVVVHDLDSRPGHDSHVATYDLIDGFDPSYMVTKALLDAELSDMTLPEIADALEAEVANGNLNDQGVQPLVEERFNRYLRAQIELRGPQVLDPLATDANRIRDAIDDLPRLARSAFEEMARKAFPEEAASLPGRAA